MAEHVPTTPRPLAPRRRKSGSATAAQTTTPPFSVPELPPITEQERQSNADILAELRALIPILRQRNLDSAVLLAQMAARGRGPLVDYFCELGRRYAHLLRVPQKPHLRAVEAEPGA